MDRSEELARAMGPGNGMVGALEFVLAAFRIRPPTGITERPSVPPM